MKTYLVLGCLVLGCGSGNGAKSPDGADFAGNASVGNAGSTNGGAGSTNGGAGSTNGGASPAVAGTPSVNGGASAAGQPGAAGAPVTVPHTVLPCDKLGPTGAWEDVTPPGLNLSPTLQTPAGENYGAHSFAINPKNTATVYVGSSAQGIFKTTDCGANWVHINTGRNGAKLDGGRQWVFVIDPVNPEVIYTNSGYSQDNAWKSTNGGVDWDPLVSDEYVKALQFHGFVHWIAIDPTNHDHLIVTPHFACEVGSVNGLPKTPNCLLETKDAGATWKILEGSPTGAENGGPYMTDANTWYYSASADGLWRTGDAGVTWSHVYKGGYAGIGDLKLSNGKLYSGGVFNVISSSDNGLTWTAIPGSPGAQFVAGDADTVFTARGVDYYTASVNDMTKWDHLPSPPISKDTNAWDLKYDADHHILYSVDNKAGFWRIVIK